MTKDQKTEVVNLILNTWDCCGNAVVAVRVWQIDNNMPLTEKALNKLYKRAHREWDESLEKIN
jgi:hypothetical protein